MGSLKPITIPPRRSAGFFVSGGRPFLAEDCLLPGLAEGPLTRKATQLDGAATS